MVSLSATLEDMTGNKIAVKRPDKNGKIVTRHMLAQPVPASIKSMPEPVLSAPRFSTTQTTIPEHVGCLQDLWDHNAISYTDHQPEDLDPRTLQEIERLLATTKVKFAFCDGIQSELNIMAECGSMTGINNIAVFGQHVLPYQSYNTVQSYVDGLGEAGLPHIDYLTEATDEQRRTAEALVRFTAQVETLPFGDQLVRYRYGESYDATYLADQELSEYLQGHPEDADDIFGMLANEGCAISVGLIQARLVHEVQSLRDGVL